MREAAAEAENTRLRAALKSVARGDGCWCGVATGNPMYHGRHSAACVQARAVLTPTSELEA
jgi:hypothetical protein